MASTKDDVEHKPGAKVTTIGDDRATVTESGDDAPPAEPRPRNHWPDGGDDDEPSEDDDDDEGDHEGQAESEALTYDPVVEPSDGPGAQASRT